MSKDNNRDNNYTPGAVNTVGEWRLKVSVEIKQIHDLLETLKQQMAEMNTTMRAYTETIIKVNDLAKDVQKLEQKVNEHTEEFKKYKSSFDKLYGKFTVTSSIFAAIIAGIIGFFFWSAQQKAVSVEKQSTTIIRKDK